VANPAKLLIEIVTESAKARKELRDTADEVEGVGESSDKMGKAMAAGAAAGAAGLVALGVAAFNAAEESAKINRETVRVLESTGAAAWISAGQVSDLAQAISDKTGADDEAIQSGANLLLTFTNIRNEAGKSNDVFDQATELALDMSVAMGKDLSSSAVQLGKALQDPVKGMTALSKSGVSFNATQKSMIEGMIAAGDLLGAQKVILAEVSKEFGGAAEAAGTPLDKLMVKIGNLQEDIGAKLIPVVQSVAQFLGDNMASALELVASNAEAVKFAALVAGAAIAAMAAPTVFAPLIATVSAVAGGVLFLASTFSAAAAQGSTFSAVMATINASLLPELGALVLIAGALYAFTAAMDKGSEAADKFFAKVQEDVDPSSFESVDQGAEKVQKRMRDLQRQLDKSSVADMVVGFIDFIVPLHNVENSVQDLQDEQSKLNQLTEEQRAKYTAASNALNAYAENAVLAAAGVDTTSEAAKRAALESANLALGAGMVSAKLSEIAKSKGINLVEDGAVARVTALYEATTFTTQSTLGMTEAQKKYNDAAATAKDKTDAYKESLDALIGIHLSAAQAETRYSKNAVDLLKTLTENRANANGALKANSDASLANINAINNNNTAIQNNVQAAIDHALAVQRDTGDVKQATAVLNEHRDQLIKVMTQLGYNETEARAYVDQLGLTPKNIQTLAELDKNKASADAAAYKAQLDGLNQTFVSKIVADTGKAEEDIRRFLLLFRNAANEARDRALQGTRASGGPVNSGGTYLVGERGPELFVPRVAGRVIANGKFTSSTSGGSTFIVNVTHSGLAVDSPKLQREIVGALRRWQKRNGTLPLQGVV
jgi:hypothetical protein